MTPAKKMHFEMTQSLIDKFLEEYKADKAFKRDDERPFVLNVLTTYQSQNQQFKRSSYESVYKFNAEPFELSRMLLPYLQTKGFDATSKHQAFYSESEKKLYQVFYVQTQAVATDDEAYAILFYFYEKETKETAKETLHYVTFLNSKDNYYKYMQDMYRDHALVDYSKPKGEIKSTWTTTNMSGRQKSEDLEHVDFEKKVAQCLERGKHEFGKQVVGSGDKKNKTQKR